MGSRKNGGSQASAVVLACGVALQVAVAADLGDTLDGYLARRASTHQFSGAVLVRHEGHTVFQGDYGRANFEHDVAITPKTRFRIGSITKPFTAAAILKLEGQGKLFLNDSICAYLESCPNEWRKVEIRHLLTHTSGVPDLFGDVEEAPVEETRTKIDEAVAAADDRSLTSPPGTRYAYNNFGYMLLGYVVEKASGQSWESYLGRMIFEPLGLSATSYDRVWEIVPHRAAGYIRRDGRLLNVEYEDHSAFAVGGLLSTTTDLATFATELASGTLLTADQTKRTLTPALDGYGFGWVIAKHFGHRVFWHNGEIGGFSSELSIYPDDALIVVVLSNVQNANPKGLACSIAAHMLGEEPPLFSERRSQPLPIAELSAYAGTYTTEDGDNRSITLEEGRLLYRGRHPLVPTANGIFYFANPDHYRAEFHRSDDGTVAGFSLSECGQELLRASKLQ